MTFVIYQLLRRMCGGCRVTVGGKVKFACVDGPEFDAHQVDFEELMRRQGMYAREEYRALWHHECKLAAETAEVEKAEHRVPMPKQDHRARTYNFNEVALGYTKEMAQEEALRCLQCKKAFCVAGCPVEIDIPAFIKLMQVGDFLGAARKIKETNALPAICGRVCPQEEQCEQVCVTGKKGDPVALYPIPERAYIEVDDGVAVKPGDLLAKTAREAAGTQDITGGLPRVTEIFEARKPKDPAVIAEIDGVKVGDYVPKSYRKAGKIMARDIVLAVAAAHQAVVDAGLSTFFIGLTRRGTTYTHTTKNISTGSYRYTTG